MNGLAYHHAISPGHPGFPRCSLSATIRGNRIRLMGNKACHEVDVVMV